MFYIKKIPCSPILPASNTGALIEDIFIACRLALLVHGQMVKSMG